MPARPFKSTSEEDKIEGYTLHVKFIDKNEIDIKNLDADTLIGTAIA